MDLDSDGHLDILSGCYSRHSQPMAGLFWLLRGDGKGGFQKPVQIEGEDGEPLIIAAREQKNGEPVVTDVICTRPFACDLDGDGALDIVAGNFSGGFAFFKGLGKGRFAAKSEWIEGAQGRLQVNAHSDPFLIDFDGDGDLDLFSGSSRGGLYYFANHGSKTEPRFLTKQELLAPSALRGGMVFGDAHITAPQGSTRVWIADTNGDGKLDVLLGDSVRLNFAAKGLSEDEVQARLASWNKESMELSTAMAQAASKGDTEKRKELNKAFSAHYKKRSEFLRSEGTGFVWVMLQK